ncbi:hypothetical protein [Saccharibacillus sacchari]|uniref:hypothetical protein n=1 Tax=Saccharibacillus sacchari TaxID=456493 RepID=UPI0004AED110|nr:hypothetical protein [Saccharibacillus sacchari]
MMLKHRQAVLHEIEEIHNALDGINIKIERYEERVDRWKSKDNNSGIPTSNDDYIHRKEVHL